MTQNRRIILNIVATYGRSLFSMACGLFTGRWVLAALGDVDYGLYGVVGGLTAFVTFFNGMLAGAVGRFYAYAVGQASRPGQEAEGLEECRKWFNTAVLIHVVVPVVLLMIGYPIGEWAVRSFLTIPVERVGSCLWVWRFVCASCFVSMVSVPCRAMYTAKQNIAELTIYTFVTASLNVCITYYMVSHPSDWLVRYAAWLCLLSIAPDLIICVRALLIYDECSFRLRYLYVWSYLKRVLAFSGVRLLNGISMMFSNQGMAVLVNKMLGPSRNAAMTVGNTLASQSLTLASSFTGAFWPVIVNAAGRGDFEGMRSQAFRTSKFSTLAILLFCIPLVFEAEEVLVLWLKTPPEYASHLCVCILIVSVLENLTCGHWMAIFAQGRIAEYQLVISVCGFSAVAIAWCLIYEGVGIVGVGVALIVAKIIANFIRLYYGKKCAGLLVGQWIRQVFVPIFLVAGMSSSIGFVVVNLFSRSFCRLLGTCLAVELFFLPITWFIVLDDKERGFVRDKLRLFLKNIHG